MFNVGCKSIEHLQLHRSYNCASQAFSILHTTQFCHNSWPTENDACGQFM